MKLKVTLTILCIGIFQSIFAYPITPKPLRELIMEAKHIVYADVIDIENMKYSDSKAILVIQEQLQGTIATDTINVFFDPYMICPSPALYFKGSKVLAFLYKTDSGYRTHSLAYGAKPMETAAYPVYKKRIMEMQQILSIKDEQEKITKTINWLVACAKNRYTRWEGTHDLSPTSNFMSYYDFEEEKIIHKHTLSKTQKEELRKVIFELKDIDYHDFNLIDLVVTESDTEMTNFLINNLKVSLTKDSFKNPIMRRIAELTNRDDLRAIAKEARNIPYSSTRNAEINQIAKKFVAKL